MKRDTKDKLSAVCYTIGFIALLMTVGAIGSVDFADASGGDPTAGIRMVWTSFAVMSGSWLAGWRLSK